MRRAILLSAIAAAALLAAVPAASAWHYTFQDFFDSQGSAIGAAVATARKCGPGGKEGVYDYRSHSLASGGQTEFEVEVTGKMSARDNWEKFKHAHVTTDASPNVPEEVVVEVTRALAEFHQTVFTRWKGPGHKLEVRHGELVMFGNQVLEPGESQTKFDPKPGC
ncbi:MAG: hypothetical protein ACJ75R_04920 [Solirubrobacterales bacterium]